MYFKPDPATLVVPRPTKEEKDRLKRRIKRSGFSNKWPLIVSRITNTLLDGCTRQEICQELGFTPKVEYIDDPPEDFERIVLEANDRRSLSKDQQAILFAERATEKAESSENIQKTAEKPADELRATVARNSDESASEPDSESAKPSAKKKRTGPGRPGSGKKTAQKEAAESAGVSERQIQKAQQLNKDAPDLAAEVKAGTKSLNAAAKEAKERKADPSPASEEKPPAPDQRLDETGQPIPPELIEDWDKATTAIKEAMQHLRKAQSSLQEVATTRPGAWLRHEGVFDGTDKNRVVAIKELNWLLNRVMPHAVCPFCQGKKKQCKAQDTTTDKFTTICEHSGMLTKKAFDNYETIKHYHKAA